MSKELEALDRLYCEGEIMPNLIFVKKYKGYKIFKSNKYYYVDKLFDKPLTSIRQCKLLIMEELI